MPAAGKDLWRSGASAARGRLREPTQRRKLTKPGRDKPQSRHHPSRTETWYVPRGSSPNAAAIPGPGDSHSPPAHEPRLGRLRSNAWRQRTSRAKRQARSGRPRRQADTAGLRREAPQGPEMITPTPARTRCPRSRTASASALVACLLLGITPTAGVLRWFGPGGRRSGGPAVRPATRARVLVRTGVAVPDQFAEQITWHAQLHGEPLVPVGHTEPGTIGQLRKAHGSHLVTHSARFPFRLAPRCTG